MTASETYPSDVLCGLCSAELLVERPRPEKYDILQLQNRSPDGWCVIEQPLGAIALDENMRLVYRLTKPNAIAIADRLNVMLTNEKIPDPE